MDCLILQHEALDIRGQLLDLTAREYSLLEYLAVKGGEVVGRTDIWEHLYDFDSDAQSNVVDVYIGYVRKKLDLHWAAGLIVTRRGQGYLLQVESDASYLEGAPLDAHHRHRGARTDRRRR